MAEDGDITPSRPDGYGPDTDENAKYWRNRKAADKGSTSSQSSSEQDPRAKLIAELRATFNDLTAKNQQIENTLEKLIASQSPGKIKF